MKEHLKFALKVGIAMLIIFGICDLVSQFAGFNLKGILWSPIASFMPTKTSASSGNP